MRPKPRNAPKRNIYQEVTDRILEALEQGVIPWHKPWSTEGFANAAGDWPRNAISGRAYNGTNVLLLWLTSMERGYKDPRWLTYNQARKAGGSVRKGEKGTLVTLWKTYKVEEDGEEKNRFVLRGFTVFSAEQCDGLNLPELEPIQVEDQAITNGYAESLVKASGAVLRHGGVHAAYSPGSDRILMPKLERFDSEQAYWSTLLHELTHWTGAEHRLNRDLSGGQGSHDYAREELVAEMGSAFLCAQLGVPLEGLQHPAYLEHWKAVLRQDNRAIIRAASQARKASEFLLDFVSEEQAAA